jgi:hypothetical protein
MDKLTITIATKDDGMQDTHAIRDILLCLADKIGDGRTEGIILSANGNTVGSYRWEVTNMRKASAAEYEKAVRIYEADGQAAVYEFARRQGIDSVSECEPCEDVTPDCEDGSCLVCGSAK